jgi:hypothetical protein
MPPVHRVCLSVSFILILTSNSLFAQYVPTAERGDPVFDRRSTMDTNAIRTSIFNFAFSGRTGAGQGIPYEWPKGTGRNYVALVGMMVGGIVQDASGDSVCIVSLPRYRSSPGGLRSWNLEPVPQYLNSSSLEIARSDNSSTWPPQWIDKLSDPTDPGWPGSWNGLLGKNSFINGTEFYLHCSDDMYDRYRYFPVPSDTNRRGLGLVIGQRVMAWHDPILEDAIVTISDIHNVGMQTISRAAATFWIADFIGGDGDSQDDSFSWNIARRTWYGKDRDGISNNPAFRNARVLMPAMALLHTPANGGTECGLTGFRYYPAGAINFSQTPDRFFWDTLMTPGRFTDPRTIGTGEYDAFMSSGYFPIPAQGHQQFVVANVFGNDSADIDRKVDYLRGLVGGRYSTNSIQVTIQSPMPGQILSGQVPIQWSAYPARSSVRVDILYSSDAGDSWGVLARGETNDGSATWNTDSLTDGIFYALKIIAYDSVGLGSLSMAGTVTINNPEQASPQIRLDQSLGRQSWTNQVPIHWVAGDADGDPVTVDIAYRINADPWATIASTLPNTGEYLMDVSAMTNSTAYSVRSTVSSTGGVDVDSTGQFEVENVRYRLGQSAFVERRTPGTGIIEPHIVSPNLATGHLYKVLFNGIGNSVTSYNVVDQTLATSVLSGATQLSGEREGPLFDGIRLLIENDSLELDQSRSGWNNFDVVAFHFGLFSGAYEMGIPDVRTFRLIMGSPGLDTSRQVLLDQYLWPRTPVNFTVVDEESNLRVPFAFMDFDISGGRFTDGDELVLLKSDSADSVRPSWYVYLLDYQNRRDPAPGDTLVLTVTGPFHSGDSYRFEAISGGLLGVKPTVPMEYSLSQNYPNPFNPQTTIRFSLGAQGLVSLEIYDILGRRIRSLLNQKFDSGDHVIQWNGVTDHGATASSGVYFYRITAGSFVQTRKMLLLR